MDEIWILLKWVSKIFKPYEMISEVLLFLNIISSKDPAHSFRCHNLQVRVKILPNISSATFKIWKMTPICSWTRIFVDPLSPTHFLCTCCRLRVGVGISTKFSLTNFKICKIISIMYLFCKYHQQCCLRKIELKMGGEGLGKTKLHVRHCWNILRMQMVP